MIAQQDSSRLQYIPIKSLFHRSKEKDKQTCTRIKWNGLICIKMLIAAFFVSLSR